MSDPYEAFEQDVPERLREDAMTMMAEATHMDGAHDCIQILDRDRIDAINCRAHGIIEIEGEEYTFQMQDGNWNGTELLAWNEDREFEHHVPAQWALQPTRDLIGKAHEEGRGSFLLLKWDAMLSNRPSIAEIPGKYSYDRRVQPGGKVETYWKAKAAEHHFDIVLQEEADATRKLLSTPIASGRKDNV